MKAGDPADISEIGLDPIETVRRFVAEGARWVHVVDLDAAVTGRPQNLSVLAEISRLPVRVQAGGSLSASAAGDAIAAGAARAVLGSAILADPAQLEEAVAKHGDRVGVAIDVRDGWVTPRGTATRGPRLEEALQAVASARPAFATYTSSSRDGRMLGPDLAVLTQVATALPIRVIASGGVRSLSDIAELASLVPLLAGAIVGRAFQEARFTVREAMAVADRRRRPLPGS